MHAGAAPVRGKHAGCSVEAWLEACQLRKCSRQHPGCAVTLLQRGGSSAVAALHGCGSCVPECFCCLLGQWQLAAK